MVVEKNQGNMWMVDGQLGISSNNITEHEHEHDILLLFLFFCIFIINNY